MRKLPLAVVLLALAALPGMLFANHSWGGYHWARTSNPFTLKLGDNLTTSDWKSHLAQTSSDWNKSTVLDTTVVTGTAVGRCKAVAGTVQVCNGSYGQNGWLGLASISVTGGTHITQGTVKVNDTYFGMARYNNSAEREHVMCQEVGHTFGLDHQDTSGASLNTCMDYYQNTSDSDTKSTTPNQHDYDELGIIYSHLDSTTTIGAAAKMPPAMSNIDFTEEANWGQLVRGSRESGQSVYLQDLGHGNKVITFVTWAK
jgi:hypothetical protein